MLILVSNHDLSYTTIWLFQIGYKLDIVFHHGAVLERVSEKFQGSFCFEDEIHALTNVGHQFKYDITQRSPLHYNMH